VRCTIATCFTPLFRTLHSEAREMSSASYGADAGPSLHGGEGKGWETRLPTGEQSFIPHSSPACRQLRKLLGRMMHPTSNRDQLLALTASLAHSGVRPTGHAVNHPRNEAGSEACCTRCEAAGSRVSGLFFWLLRSCTSFLPRPRPHTPTSSRQSYAD
jgi:hypothetical protein